MPGDMLETSGIASSSKKVITQGMTSFIEGTPTLMHHGGYFSHTSSPFPPSLQHWKHQSTWVLWWSYDRWVLPFVQKDGPENAAGAVTDAALHRNVCRDVTEPSEIDIGTTG